MKLQSFAEDRFGEDRGGRRAVTGDVAGLRGDFFHELRAHVLERVFEFDVLGDGHAVLGHLRRAPALVEDGIASARPECAFDRSGELGDPFEQALADVFVVTNQLGHSSSSTSKRGRRIYGTLNRGDASFTASLRPARLRNERLSDDMPIREQTLCLWVVMICKAIVGKEMW
jgi:hypothetical protein